VRYRAAEVDLHAYWTRFRKFVSELGAPLALGVAALGFLAFAGIADEALEGDTHGFDEAVLLAMREPGDSTNPVGPPWVEHAVADITALGGYAVLTLIVLAAASFLVLTGKRAAALFVIAAPLSGAVLSETLKLGFARPRPDLVAHLAEVQSMSFPSGHAMLSAITFLTLGALLAQAHERRRIKNFVLGAGIVLTMMVGISRVYLGVHWPTDVLAGWSLGAAWAALWWLAADWLRRRGEA
jgi:undecaprenyl-diphosphatase